MSKMSNMAIDRANTERGQVLYIMAQHGFTPKAADPEDGDWIQDALDDRDCNYALFVYYMDEMPYGTQKARTGDPYEWLFERLSRVL